MKNGFLICDKQAGITSFKVVAQIKKSLQIKKAGHLGTLDPLATGVLVIALGEGTKLIEYFMKKDKIYEAQFELGKVSDTYDKEGKIKQIVVNPNLSKTQIQKALVGLKKAPEQIPPVFSALKINGERAYNLARSGQNFTLKARPINIYSLKLIYYQGCLGTLRIHCSSGTYIRSLIHDLGQKLGCGAIMTSLKRLSVGDFKLEEACSNNSYLEKIISPEQIVSNWPKLNVNFKEFQALRTGQSILAPCNCVDADTITPLAIFYMNKLVSLTKKEGPYLKSIKNLNRFFETPSLL